MARRLLEVIVDFLGGDPDRPVITGRVYTNLQKTPYPLSENKTRSGWRSNSSPPSSTSTHGNLLSPRERTVLNLINDGQSNKNIARTLGISPETVKSHVKNIFAKLAVEKRTQAINRARSLGLVRTI